MKPVFSEVVYSSLFMFPGFMSWHLLPTFPTKFTNILLGTLWIKGGLNCQEASVITTITALKSLLKNIQFYSRTICLHFMLCLFVERDSSVVECRTRNRESPGSNPLCYRFELWPFSFSSRRLSRLSCINEYLAIDSGGHVSE